jgi:hypothetical protein
MESPPTGPGRTLIMTRAGAIGIALGLICMSFPAGWILSKVDSERSIAARIAAIEARHADEVKDHREYAFGPYFDHLGPDGRPVDQDVALRDFRPTSEDSVTWSHIGGLGGIDRHIKVSGDGTVAVSDAAGTSKVATLTEVRCSDFFRKVISSGLAGYSDEAVFLKIMLQQPNELSCITCGSTTRVRIVIQELKVDREFDLYLPEVESKNYPDIIEYRSAVEIEKEIQSFAP